MKTQTKRVNVWLTEDTYFRLKAAAANSRAKLLLFGERVIRAGLDALAKNGSKAK